ncbi:MAG: DUF1572 family protein [Bacteroidetes bacterium]|nr:DUF1572 family protein [Bacteroidota bacterium]
MESVFTHIEALLVRDLGGMKREIEAYPDDAQIWAVVPGIANPAGTLAIHGCGNLKHYIGFVLGGVPYTRDRANEFANRTMTRNEIYREIESTISVLEMVLPQLDESVLGTTYPEAVGGFQLNTQQFLMHLCSHLSLHLGQMGYLRRFLSGANQSTSPALLAEIAENK